MKTTSLFGLLWCVLAGSALALDIQSGEQSRIWSDGRGVWDCPGLEKWYQPPDPAGNLLASQDDTTIPFRAEVADDFMGDGQYIWSIGWWGGYWGGSPRPPDAFEITIYAKATGDCPGEVLYQEVDSDYHETLVGTSADYCIELDENFYKAPGVNYQVSIVAVLNYPPQWGWAVSSQGNGKQVCFRSEYFSFPDWVPGIQVFGAFYETAFVLFNKDDGHQGDPCPPEAGVDNFDETLAAFLYDAQGQLNLRPVIVEGPTEVYRGWPEHFPDGHCEINTEIGMMYLTGYYNPSICHYTEQESLYVVVVKDPTVASPGMIVSSSDTLGNPSFPDTSDFFVHVLVDVETLPQPKPHVVHVAALLEDSNLWDDPPCVESTMDAYEQGYPNVDHAHIPCPSRPPKGCCQLPSILGDECFETYEVLCEMFGGTYYGDDTICDPAECCKNVGINLIKKTSWGEVKSRYR